MSPHEQGARASRRPRSDDAHNLGYRDQPDEQFRLTKPSQGCDLTHTRTRKAPHRPKPAGRSRRSDQTQKSQSSSSVLSALPITYDDPDPEKKSWFSSALGDSADKIAGFTSVASLGNIGSYPRFIRALFAL
jgi:hypothetical protein